MNEADVIGKVLSGNVEAYGVLVRKYAALLAGAARHITCNADDAEDLAQEAFIDAYTNLSRLRDRGAYRAWVFGILRFKCIDYLRQRKPEALNLDEYAEIISAPKQEDTGDLTELLNALPLQDHEVLAARYIQDLDYRDIAEALGVSEEAARMRCSRARSRLRAISERQIRQGMGAFLALPLTAGFENRAMQRVRQAQVTSVAAPASSGPMLLAGLSLKAATWLAVLLIGVGIALFCVLRPKTAGWHAMSSAGISRNQTTIEARSKRVEPKIIAKGEMILVGSTSDGSDIHGLWVKYEDKEKAIKHKVEGTCYEWHDWDAHKCMVASEVTEVDAIPEGMSVMRLPAGQYAVFTHRLANGGYEGLNPVMEKWLQTGPYEQVGDDSIQVFDGRFKGGNQPDSEIDFLIPIKPRA